MLYFVDKLTRISLSVLISVQIGLVVRKKLECADNPKWSSEILYWTFNLMGPLTIHVKHPCFISVCNSPRMMARARRNGSISVKLTASVGCSTTRSRGLRPCIRPMISPEVLSKVESTISPRRFGKLFSLNSLSLTY